MSAYNYAFTLTPGRSSRTRSFAVAGAAITAVCVLSSTVVMRDLVATQPARAATVAIPATATAIATAAAPPTTKARTWALEPRWWPGEIRRIVQPAVGVPDSELTFAKGYQLRLAARQATQPAAHPANLPAQVAINGPSAESQPGRTATPARKASTVARTEMPIVQRVSATRSEPSADPFARFDAGSRALAYDEQRPSTRGGIAYRPAPPSRGLFGTLY